MRPLLGGRIVVAHCPSVHLSVPCRKIHIHWTLNAIIRLNHFKWEYLWFNEWLTIRWKFGKTCKYVNINVECLLMYIICDYPPLVAAVVHDVHFRILIFFMQKWVGSGHENQFLLGYAKICCTYDYLWSRHLFKFTLLLHSIILAPSQVKIKH